MFRIENKLVIYYYYLQKYFTVKACHLVKFSGNQNHNSRVLTICWRFLTDISLLGTSPIQSPKRLTLQTIQGHSLDFL